MKEHVLKEKHQQACKKVEALEAKQILTGKRSQKVGHLLSSLAYQGFLEGDTFSSFERKVTVLQCAKVDVGDVNHGREFPTRLLPHVVTVLQSQLKKYIETPLPCTGRRMPFSIVADKLTHKRVTKQVTAIRIPIFSNGSLFKTVYLSSAVVKASTGAALAAYLIETLKKIGLQTSQLQEGLSGMCFDGQYIMCNVPRHICDTLELGDDKASSLCESAVWDYAHRLNLADKDARKERWVASAITTTQNFMKEFTHGQAFLSLKAISEELQIPFLFPVLFSTTRFTQHQHRVWRAFLTDYPSIFKTYQNVIEDAERVAAEASNSDDSGSPTPSARRKPTTAAIANAKQSLAKLQKASTVLEIAALLDISEILKTTSCTLQRDGQLPWKCHKAIVALFSTLSDYSKALTNGHVSMNNTFVVSAFKQKQ
ncbi:uncharacterized protein LOC108950546 [Ciona intestinalis]